MIATWYLVVVYLGGGAPVTIPQPDRALCEQNVAYINAKERMYAFCVAGSK
jgi:hypothetical protein